MPVARDQIEELYGIFRKYVSQTQWAALLGELQETQAYRQNQSFRATIDRLRALSHPLPK